MLVEKLKEIEKSKEGELSNMEDMIEHTSKKGDLKTKQHLGDIYYKTLCDLYKKYRKEVENWFILCKNQGQKPSVGEFIYARKFIEDFINERMNLVIKV